MKWYYEAAGKPAGPVSQAELDELIARGAVTPKTQVWREGMRDWQLLYEARPELDPNALRCASCADVIPRGEGRQVRGLWCCERCALDQQKDAPSSAAKPPALPADAALGPAWERREELGIFASAIKTVRQVLVNPASTFANMPLDGGLAGPLAYAVLVGTVGNIAHAAYQVMMAHRTPPDMIPPALLPHFDRLKEPGFVLQSGLLAPVLITAVVIALAGVLHVLLLLLSGATRGWDTTCRVASYSFGSAAILLLIPYFGPIVAVFWGAICLSLGLAHAHQIRAWQATLAVTLPLFVLVLFIIVAIGTLLQIMQQV